jgi:hypothetical protein
MFLYVQWFDPFKYFRTFNFQPLFMRKRGGQFSLIYTQQFPCFKTIHVLTLTPGDI